MISLIVISLTLYVLTHYKFSTSPGTVFISTGLLQLILYICKTHDYIMKNAKYIIHLFQRQEIQISIMHTAAHPYIDSYRAS